jgi:hypothetical protein
LLLLLGQRLIDPLPALRGGEADGGEKRERGCAGAKVLSHGDLLVLEAASEVPRGIGSRALDRRATPTTSRRWTSLTGVKSDRNRWPSAIGSRRLEGTRWYRILLKKDDVR